VTDQQAHLVEAAQGAAAAQRTWTLEGTEVIRQGSNVRDGLGKVERRIPNDNVANPLGGLPIKEDEGHELRCVQQFHTR